MQVASIDRPEYRWIVLLDDAGAPHRYVRNGSAQPECRPHVRILSHGFVRFSESGGIPVLDGRGLPDSIVVERQGDCFRYDEP